MTPLPSQEPLTIVRNGFKEKKRNLIFKIKSLKENMTIKDTDTKGRRLGFEDGHPGTPVSGSWRQSLGE